MEDDDIAVVTNGILSIHRVNRQAGEDPIRAIQTLQMELQQIMKGQEVYDHSIQYFFMIIIFGTCTQAVLVVANQILFLYRSHLRPLLVKMHNPSISQLLTHICSSPLQATSIPICRRRSLSSQRQ